MSTTLLIAEVRRRTGLPSSDPFAADADLTAILAEALNGIATDRDWPWLETATSFNTANGTVAYSVPADWMRTRTLQVAGSQPMDSSRSRQQLETFFPNAAAGGEPEFFVVSSDAIRLYPTPDGVYSVSHVYWKRETQLANPGDVPLMPSWAWGAITWQAASILFRRTAQDARADQAQEEADRWIRRLADNARRTSGPVRVRVRPGSFI